MDISTLDENNDFLESLMAEAIREKQKIDNQNTNQLDESDDDWLGEIDDVVDEIINEPEPDRRQRDVKTAFKHSTQAMLTTGTHKGVNVDVKYVIPGKAEIEISVTEEVYSDKPLENGDMVNNCIILSKINKNRYLGNCIKVTFLKTGEYETYRGNEVEITRGPLTGMYGFIKTIFRPRVGILLNNSPITVDVDDIFYKDLLLKNGKYFNVTDVKLDDTNSYIINGIELGDKNAKTIRLDDVQEMMPGFKLGFHEDQEDSHSDDESLMIAEEKSVFDSDSENELSDDSLEDIVDRDDIFEENDTYETDENEARSTFRDVERTSVMFQGFSTQQKSYIDTIKRISNIMTFDESLVNNFEIVEQIESVLSNFDSKITKAGENFVIYSSQIDIKMIIACLIVYKLTLFDDKFVGFDEYIKTLFNNAYFSGDYTTSMLVELYDVFKCTEIKRTNIELERVTMLMKCYNRLLQKMLGINLALKPKIEKVKYEPISRKERPYDNRTFILPDQLIPEIKLSDSDLNKNILWGPDYLKRIPKWENYIRDKALSSKGNTRKVYQYVRSNISNSPVLLQKLKKQIIELLKQYIPKFINDFDICKDDSVCIDNTIDKHIKIVIDKKLSQEQKDTISYYLAMKKFVPDFLADMTKVKTNIQSKKEKRLQTTKMEKQSLQERRNRIAQERDQKPTIVDKLKNILIRVFKEKFDTTCRDDDCKFKQVLVKVKRVLSNQEQMLLNKDELEMFRNFAAQHSDYKLPEPPKIPKIILRLKKPDNL